MSFTVTATDGEARAGVLRTAHGDVPTPAFMPVGTKATVKGLDPERLRELGTTILLGNTYHLHFRPGDGLIAELGGLHRFMGWDGPILTDSGGFQVFSLRDTIVAADDDGVTFRSVYDGEEARFTPELAADDPAPAGLGRRHVPRHLPCRPTPRERCSPSPSSGRRAGRVGSSRRPAPTASSSSASPRVAPIRSSADAPWRRSRRSASTATRSAG